DYLRLRIAESGERAGQLKSPGRNRRKGQHLGLECGNGATHPVYVTKYSRHRRCVLQPGWEVAELSRNIRGEERWFRSVVRRQALGCRDGSGTAQFIPPEGRCRSYSVQPRWLADR